MQTGKKLRCRKILRDGRAVVVPFDHPLFSGPVQGVEDPIELTRMITRSKADAILVSPGILEKIKDEVADLGIILRIDGTHTRLGSHIERIGLIASVEQAVKLGADMVVVNIFVGTDNEDMLLEKLGRVACACRDWGMPLMAEMIPASRLSAHYAKSPAGSPGFGDEIALVSRLGVEIGADAVKTLYTGDQEEFGRIVAATPAPVIIAGGPKAANDEDLLQSVREAMTAGAAGVAFGRNVWQHREPEKFINELAKLVHGA